MTEQELAAIEARANAATAGPWWYDPTGEDGEAIRSRGVESPRAFLADEVIGSSEWLRAKAEDVAFIAHARTDVPALVAAVRERNAEIARLRGLIGAWAGDVLDVTGRDFELGFTSNTEVLLREAIRQSVMP